MTAVKNNTISPIWNTIHTFPLSFETIDDLLDAKCLIRIKDEDVSSSGIKSYDDLGQCSYTFKDILRFGEHMKASHSIVMKPDWIQLQLVPKMRRVCGRIKFKLSLIMEESDSSNLLAEVGVSSLNELINAIKIISQGKSLKDLSSPATEKVKATTGIRVAAPINLASLNTTRRNQIIDENRGDIKLQNEEACAVWDDMNELGEEEKEHTIAHSLNTIKDEYDENASVYDDAPNGGDEAYPDEIDTKTTTQASSNTNTSNTSNAGSTTDAVITFVEISASKCKNVDGIMGKNDLYVEMSYDSWNVRTDVRRDAGSDAKWDCDNAGKAMVLECSDDKLRGEGVLVVKVIDDNSDNMVMNKASKLIGEASLKLSSLLSQSPCPLDIYNEKKELMGHVDLAFTVKRVARASGAEITVTGTMKSSGTSDASVKDSEFNKKSGTSSTEAVAGDVNQPQSKQVPSSKGVSDLPAQKEVMSNKKNSTEKQNASKSSVVELVLSNSKVNLSSSSANKAESQLSTTKNEEKSSTTLNNISSESVSPVVNAIQVLCSEMEKWKSRALEAEKKELDIAVALNSLHLGTAEIDITALQTANAMKSTESDGAKNSSNDNIPTERSTVKKNSKELQDIARKRKEEAKKKMQERIETEGYENLSQDLVYVPSKKSLASQNSESIDLFNYDSGKIDERKIKQNNNMREEISNKNKSSVVKDIEIEDPDADASTVDEFDYTRG
jgi:hypothetical protein